MVIGCDRVDRRKSGGDGSQAAAERGYHSCLGKLEERGSAIVEMGSRLGDKVEGTVTVSSLWAQALEGRRSGKRSRGVRRNRLENVVNDEIVKVHHSSSGVVVKNVKSFREPAGVPNCTRASPGRA